jgi:hypothetical protein
MSHSNENPPAENFEDTELSGVDREEFLLLDLQSGQEHALEKSGVADKARQVLIDEHQNLVDRYQRSDLAMDLPPEPPAQSADMKTRLSVVLHREKHPTGRITEEPTIRFTTTETNGEGGTSQAFKYVKVGGGEAVNDKNISFFERVYTPEPPFTSEDMRIVAEELEKVRQAQVQGELSHLDGTLAAVRRPNVAMAKMPYAS